MQFWSSVDCHSIIHHIQSSRSETKTVISENYVRMCEDGLNPRFAACMFCFKKSLPCILKKPKPKCKFFPCIHCFIFTTCTEAQNTVVLKVRLWIMSYQGLPTYQTCTNMWIMLGTSMEFLGPRCSSTDQTFPAEYRCIVRAMHSKGCQRDWSLPSTVLSRQLTSREALGIALFASFSFRDRVDGEAAKREVAVWIT